MKLVKQTLCYDGCMQNHYFAHVQDVITTVYI